VDASFAVILNSKILLTIGDRDHVDAGALQKAREQVGERPRGREAIQLARRRARERHELRERIDFQRGSNGDGAERIRARCDRHEIAIRIIGQLLPNHRKDSERCTERIQQRMIVMHTNERRNADLAIGAGPIFDNDRLLPTIGKPVRKKPCRNVRGAAGSDGHNDANRSLGPGLGRCRYTRRHKSNHDGEDADATSDRAHDVLQSSMIETVAWSAINGIVNLLLAP